MKQMLKSNKVGRSVVKRVVLKGARRKAGAVTARRAVKPGASGLVALGGEPVVLFKSGNGNSAQAGGLSAADLEEKVRELLIIAKEQGHLTSDDVDDALLDCVVTPADLDQIYSKLANLEVKIV